MSNKDRVEGVLKDVLIKEVGGNMHDKVFVVNELPKSLLFIKHYPWMPEINKMTGKLEGKLIRNRQAGRIIDELKPGIKVSQTGDGGFVFDSGMNEGRERLTELDKYIATNLPKESPILKREIYSREPGNPGSPPRMKHELPRVVLSVSSPPVAAQTATVQGQPSILTEPLVKRKRKN